MSNQSNSNESSIYFAELIHYVDLLDGTFEIMISHHKFSKISKKVRENKIFIDKKTEDEIEYHINRLNTMLERKQHRIVSWFDHGYGYSTITEEDAENCNFLADIKYAKQFRKTYKFRCLRRDMIIQRVVNEMASWIRHRDSHIIGILYAAVTHEFTISDNAIRRYMRKVNINDLSVHKFSLIQSFYRKMFLYILVTICSDKPVDFNEFSKACNTHIEYKKYINELGIDEDTCHLISESATGSILFTTYNNICNNEEFSNIFDLYSVNKSLIMNNVKRVFPNSNYHTNDVMFIQHLTSHMREIISKHKEFRCDPVLIKIYEELGGRQFCGVTHTDKNNKFPVQINYTFTGYKNYFEIKNQMGSNGEYFAIPHETIALDYEKYKNTKIQELIFDEKISNDDKITKLKILINAYPLYFENDKFFLLKRIYNNLENNYIIM